MINQVNQMIAKIIDWYAVDINGIRTLDPHDIPENDINNLTALILSQDDWLSSEANGPDNPEWERSMLPALLKTMQTQKNGYSMEEFHDVWTSGVRAYVMKTIAEMIDEALEVLNEDKVCHTSLIWDRASEKTVEIRSHG